MAKTITITAVRNILRTVDGYKRDSSAPSISTNSDGIIRILFHQLDQVLLARRCEKNLKAKGLSVTNRFPELIIEQ